VSLGVRQSRRLLPLLIVIGLRIARTKEAIVKSTVIKRSVVVARRKTSISLEQEFWEALKDVARADRTTVPALLVMIRGRHQGNLSSAVRVHVFEHFRAKASGVSATRSEAFEKIPALANGELQAL
jgi:predicted DNA-binding ribbon-helix-helix protein